jgi:hypothetical protein
MQCSTGSRRVLAALFLCVTPPAWPAPPGWIAVDAATLERQRGGFTTASGLEVSLGIERLVTINGTEVARTSIRIADIGSLSAEQARETGAALSAVKLVQNGAGNNVMTAFSNDILGGTIIQNTLNDQRIESRTLISASVNSMDLLHTLHFHGNVSEAIARAAGP